MLVWLASYPRSGNHLLRTILQRSFDLGSYDIYQKAARPIDPKEAAVIGVRRFEDETTDEFVTAPVLADSREEALDALAILETCPVIGRVVKRDVNVVTDLDELLQGAEDFVYPRQRRYAADNMWTSASADALLPDMHRIVASLPPAPSHMLWLLWGPPRKLPDMAFSMQDNLYIALYSVWDNEAEDAGHQAWVTDHMRALEARASGIQLADENLGARPFRFLADDNFRRLEAIRSRRDPGGVFHSYMGVPSGGGAR